MSYNVYIHIFPNGKRYIGLTTLEVKKRWRGGSGYKGQKIIYNAIKKYRWKNIQHIVYEVDTESEMKYLEKYLIAYYNTTNHKYGYNVSTGGDGNPGVPSKKRIPVDQYDSQGNFIRTWESMYLIEKELNWNWSNISKCINKKRPTAYGFYWSYTGELPEFKKIHTKRKVLQYDLNGNLIAEYKSAADAARSLGKDKSTISKCCNGKRKTAYKYVWTYAIR